MYLIYEIGTSLSEAVLLYLFFQNWADKRDWNTSSIWICYVGYFVVNCCYTVFPILPAARAVLNFVCVALLFWFLYQRSIQVALWSSALFTALAVLSEYLVMIGLRGVGIAQSELLVFGAERLLCNSLSKVVNLVVVMVATVILGRRHSLLTPKKLMAMLPCQVISIYICHVFYSLSSHENTIQNSFIIVLLGLLYLNFIMVFLAEYLSYQAKVQQQQALAEQRFLLQQAYYEQVQQDQAETHALWHDIKKYMTAMQAMVASGNTTAKEELAGLERAFSRIGNVVDVGNAEVNAILNHEVQRATASGVKLKLDIHIPPQLSVSALDISVILGNTLDNAIEACQNLPQPQRVVQAKLRQQNQMLFYSVENPYDRSQPQKTGKYHGYGLKNVEDCIRRCHGNLSIEDWGNRFVVSVRLNTNHRIE